MPLPFVTSQRADFYTDLASIKEFADRHKLYEKNILEVNFCRQTFNFDNNKCSAASQ